MAKLILIVLSTSQPLLLLLPLSAARLQRFLGAEEVSQLSEIKLISSVLVPPHIPVAK